MKIVFSRLAVAELDDILSYIAERSPRAAVLLERRVRRALTHIAAYPLAAERVEQRPEIHRLPLAVYPYVIYYTVGQDEVTVLRILHGARQRPWEPEKEGR